MQSPEIRVELSAFPHLVESLGDCAGAAPAGEIDFRLMAVGELAVGIALLGSLALAGSAWVLRED